MSEWTGDLDDDCTLERYGLRAHVECMDRGHWWFCVGRGEFPNCVELYNTADNATVVRLTTGEMARAAAECVMELLHSHSRLIAAAPELYEALRIAAACLEGVRRAMADDRIAEQQMPIIYAALGKAAVGANG